MKNLITAAGLFTVLLIFGLFAASQISEAQQNVVANLLDLPAPPPPNPLAKYNDSKHAAEFYSRENPPKDDASVEDLLDYWAAENRFDPQRDYTVKPSDAAIGKILAEIEKNPELLGSYLNVLPENKETAALVKRIYDDAASEDETDPEQSSQIKDWLKFHSDYFIEDLFKAAQQARDEDGYVTNQEELLALASVDWDRARPLLDRMLANDAQPVSQTLARWAFYQHALRENDRSEATHFREQLQAAVENRNAAPGNRDLAMDALVLSGDFEGRDDWYYKLLSDESLYDLRSAENSPYTGLTTLLTHSPPEKYTAKMLELVKSDNQTIRMAAARNLAAQIDGKNPEVVRTLLPWLEKREWAVETSGERQKLIQALAAVEMPESVPGLIAALSEKETREFPPSVMTGGSRMSNMSNGMAMSGGSMSNGMRTATRDIYPLRSAAITALAKQKDARAIAPLRAILPLVETYERGAIVRALLACRGFTVVEQVEALEAVAEQSVAKTAKLEAYQAAISAASSRNTSSAAEMETAEIDDSLRPASLPMPRYDGNGAALMSNTMSGEGYARIYSPAEAKFVLGSQLITISEVGDELVAATVRRIDELERKNPPLAFALRKIMQNWTGAAVNAALLRDLKTGKTDADAVVKLLSVRRELREKQSNDIYDTRGVNNPLAAGVAACLLEDAGNYDRILADAGNAETKTAMLACARLVRAKLPVRAVAENLRSGNKQLALAAERFLESEDSPEARGIVLSIHPNEAKILGAMNAFNTPNDGASKFLGELFASVNDGAAAVPYYMFFLRDNTLETDEKRLQKEVKETGDLLGVYAYDSNYVRIYKDKAVFSWAEDEARYRERVLSAAEFGSLKSYVAAQNAEEMPPFLSACDGCESKEFLMLGRGGGRRVFYRSDRAPAFFAELDRMFKEMREQPAALHYQLEKSLSGLEIIFADENLQARAVWKNADDFRVLIEDESQRKQIDKELNRLDRAESEKEDYDYEKGEELQQKQRAQREFENFSWHKVERGDNSQRLGDTTSQPQATEYIPPRDGSSEARRAAARQWKARTASNVEIKTGADGGLYKVAGQKTTKIHAGNYDSPVVSPDGRWAVAAKYGEETGISLVRINLLTNKEFKIKTEQYPRFETIAYVAAVDKFLIFGGSFGDYESTDAARRNGRYFLLDAETGLMQPAKGEFRPLAQQTFRPLQPTSGAAADEFWAAIPDERKGETQVGIYSAKTFSFKTLLTVPRIKFDSMDLWTDERENKIYFVYEGHLLALPLPKT